MAGRKPTRIEAPKLKGGDRKRSPLQGTKRAFAIDGTHAFLRRKRANPAIIERTAAKVEAGEYRHVATFDDVEVYEIADSSPLRRKKMDLSQLSVDSLVKLAVDAVAGKRKDGGLKAPDFKLYRDIVEELYSKVREEGHMPAFAAAECERLVKYITFRSLRRGGPSQFAISHALGELRKQRSGRSVYLAH